VSTVLGRPELAERLAARSAAVVDDIVARVLARLRERVPVDIEPASLRGSGQDNINILLHLLANPNEAGTARPPHRTVSLIRALARSGMPLYDVVDAYLLVERSWIHACVEELTDLADAVPSALASVLYLLDLDRLFVEHNLRLLAAEYEQERVRWAEHGKSLRSEAIEGLLSGDRAAVGGAEAALGYRLGRRHVAAIIWALDPAAGESDPIRFDEAISALDRALGAVGTPLVTSRDRSIRWIWFPVKDAPLDTAAIRDTLNPLGADFSIALGEPAEGPDGFARSHRQAAAAYSVGKHAVAHGGRALVVPYQEVGAIAFLAADLGQARDWVTQTLGRLALDAPRESELRDTLEAYLGSGGSVSAAARVLNCHRNTVHYRLSAAEKLLGHPVADFAPDLPLALAAARWLGAAVLVAPAAPPERR